MTHEQQETIFQAIADLKHSPGWRMVTDRIEKMKVRAVNELRRDLDHAQSQRVRGTLTALDDVLQLPNALRKEAEQGVVNDPTEVPV